jgi:hypothetical protein
MITRGLISIFALPQEIDDLHLTLYNLKRNMAMLPWDVQMDIHITFCPSEELTDWKKTTLPPAYFLSKFNSLRPLLDWSKNPKIHIEYNGGILGCVSHRRDALQYADQYDFTIWLDCDMFFSDTTILYLASSYKAAVDNGHENVIITPQFVRQWDASWDVIVHESYKNHALMYHEQADIISDALYQHGDISLVPLNDFKFAGGWCTLLSNDLLKIAGIPESFGHYGLEDTFIVEACKMLKASKHESNPVQFVLNHHIVGENYKYRCNHALSKFVVSKNRKEEFRAVATANFNKELLAFKERMKL